MTATSPSGRRRMISLPSIPVMRAEPCAAEVVTGTCQPCQERACMPHRLQHDREEPGRHLLAGRDDGVVLARVMQNGRFAHPRDELVGHSRHGRDDDRDGLPPSISRLTWRATLRMRSTLATDVPPNFITTTAIGVSRCAP